MNNYEAVLIARAALSSDALEKLAEEMKGLIAKHKGEVAQLQTWGKRRLAFPIKKQQEGYYFLLEFALNPSELKKIEHSFTLNDSLLRTMVIKKEA